MIKLIQLPVPDPRRTYTEGNIPLAAGYLAAVSDRPVSILPREIADRGGDAAVLRWILDDPPAVLGMTSFMWNVERNIWLARRVRDAAPECRIILGGPEITADHSLVDFEVVDAVVVGEGERAFPRFLAEDSSQAARSRVYSDCEPVVLDGVPDPYLMGVLTPRKGEILYLETMRGCPYGCEYCFYSKQHRNLRFFPRERAREVFRLAREREVSEIYLMDPSFNLTPGLVERLKRMAEWNPERIPIHSEARLESITPEIAVAMQKAGFRSVEVGLQSTNPEALADVGRTWDREGFIRGAGLLKDMEIRAQTGVIMGLPGDTVADFLRTLDFLLELDLAENLELYPLSLLPGTRLRERAREAGIRYQDLPPYQVTATPRMDMDDFKLAVVAAEDRLGIEFYPPQVPVFSTSEDGFIEYMDLRSAGDSLIESFLARPERIAFRLTLRITPRTPERVLDRVGAWLDRFNPHTLVQLVIEADEILPDGWCQRLSNRFWKKETYFDRLHIYRPIQGGRHSVRLFHLTADPRILERLMAESYPCDPVFRYTPGILEKVRPLLEERPALLLETRVTEREREELNTLYRGFENMMVDVSEEVTGQ